MTQMLLPEEQREVSVSVWGNRRKSTFSDNMSGQRGKEQPNSEKKTKSALITLEKTSGPAEDGFCRDSSLRCSHLKVFPSLTENLSFIIWRSSMTVTSDGMPSM